MRSVDNSLPPGLLLCLILFCGCLSREAYLVQPADLSRSEQSIPARRAKDGKQVRLRTSALPGPGDVAPLPQPDGTVLVPTRRLNPMATAGAALTYVGAAFSVAGTLIFLLAPGDRSDFSGLRLVGGLMAL